MEVIFENSKLILYDDYLIYKEFNNKTETTIKKDEIRTFDLGASTFTSTKRAGSVGVSVKVAKGVYMRKSQPHYTKTTHTQYSPKMILKNGVTYFLGDTFEYNKSFYDITNNIFACNKWIEIENLNVLSEIIKKREREAKLTGIIMICWVAGLFLSLFTLNIWIIFFVAMLPCFYALFETIKTFIKKKNWTGLVIIIIVLFLISCNFILE